MRDKYGNFDPFHDEDLLQDMFRELRPHTCARCDEPGYERYSCGITAGYWCDDHWKTSGYRGADASIDEGYAGESIDPDF